MVEAVDRSEFDEAMVLKVEDLASFFAGIVAAGWLVGWLAGWRAGRLPNARTELEGGGAEVELVW